MKKRKLEWEPSEQANQAMAKYLKKHGLKGLSKLLTRGLKLAALENQRKEKRDIVGLAQFTFNE